jgi:hypothetical protein
MEFHLPIQTPELLLDSMAQSSEQQTEDFRLNLLVLLLHKAILKSI